MQWRENFLLFAFYSETYSYAAEAAEFRAVWAETSIPQFLHADEAAKHLRDALHRDGRWNDNSLQSQKLPQSLIYITHSVWKNYAVVSRFITKLL